MAVTPITYEGAGVGMELRWWPDPNAEIIHYSLRGTNGDGEVTFNVTRLELIEAEDMVAFMIKRLEGAKGAYAFTQMEVE